MKKRILALLLVLTCLSGLFLVPAYAAFSDVPENTWYSESVDYVYMNGLFKGTKSDEFSPDTVMSRAMFVTVLYRMSRELREDYPTTGFPDVPDDSWYTVATNWAVANGLVNGTDEGTFCPEDPVTREQICKLVVLYCDHMGFTLPQTEDPIAFHDQSEISDYAGESVEACLRAGLVKGTDKGNFDPQGEASRAQVAAILQRLGRLMEAEGYIIGPGNPAADWRMILVNRWNPMPSGYVSGISLTYVNNYERIDSRAYSDYSAMVSAMRAAGLSPYVNSGFRSHDTQKYLYNNKINQYISYGYSRAQAEILAQQWVAVPGTSEHELGLAIDFNMYMWNSTAVHTWLAGNAHKYGFIYRYKAEKMDNTGINPEAWHYRYVGIDNAIRITESGLCLEEYIEKYG